MARHTLSPPASPTTMVAPIITHSSNSPASHQFETPDISTSTADIPLSNKRLKLSTTDKSPHSLTQNNTSSKMGSIMSRESSPTHSNVNVPKSTPIKSPLMNVLRKKNSLKQSRPTRQETSLSLTIKSPLMPTSTTRSVSLPIYHLGQSTTSLYLPLFPTGCLRISM